MIYEPEPEDGCEPDVEARASSRCWFMEQANIAAHRGNGIAGALFALEHSAQSFFLGMDYDDDEEDLDLDIF